MLGISAGYSQSGGWSGNYRGVQITKNGASFSPSVGVGIELYSDGVYSYSLNKDSYIFDGTKMKNDDELHSYIYKNIGDKANIEETLKTKTHLGNKSGIKGYSIDERTGLFVKNEEYSGGFTIARKGLISWLFRLNSEIYISPGAAGLISDNNTKMLKMIIIHEYIHSWHHTLHHQGKITTKQFNKYTEPVAYSYSIAYSKVHRVTNQVSKFREQLIPYPNTMSWTNISYLFNLW